jgi:hypothetical protein
MMTHQSHHADARAKKSRAQDRDFIGFVVLRTLFVRSRVAATTPRCDPVMIARRESFGAAHDL